MGNCVYIIVNKTTGRTYVGFTTQDPKKRWRQHGFEKRKTNLGVGLSKYGREDFVREVFGVYATKEQGLAAEIELIWLIRDMGIPCYNSTSGGEHFSHDEETKSRMRGRVVSAETRSKISKAGKGRPLSEETKEKLRKINTGRKFPAEFGAKMSRIMMGNKNGANSPRNTGHRHTEEVRAIISKASTEMWKRRRAAEE